MKRYISEWIQSLYGAVWHLLLCVLLQGLSRLDRTYTFIPCTASVVFSDNATVQVMQLAVMPPATHI